jgi:hypothetical protein
MTPISAAPISDAATHVHVADDVFEIELTGYCGWPSCRKPFPQTTGRGRRKEFCSETCRRGADRDYKRARAMVEHFEKLLTRSRYDVATFGRGDEEVETPDVQARLFADANAALQRAQAVLEWAQVGDQRLLVELRLLVEGVAPVIET